MAERLIMTVVVALLLVAATSYGVAIAAGESAGGASSSCDQSVTHDSFMNSEAISAVNETGAATSSVSNTRVTVEETAAFVRLRADNPNGYCVTYVVEVSPEIVAAADLGSISSNEEHVEASWRAVQNLSSGDVHTRVEFNLGPGENATFAPSTVRVRSLSWTGEAKRSGGSVLTRVRNLWGSPYLEEREYTIEATESSDAITVPLEDGKGGEVEEWLASYEVDGQTRPVTQDASAPVYYTESSRSVTFHFNDRTAVVDFTAEPNVVDRYSHSASSWWGGITGAGDWLPITTTASTGGIQS